jgi:hypothetical protein
MASVKIPYSWYDLRDLLRENWVGSDERLDQLISYLNDDFEEIENFISTIAPGGPDAFDAIVDNVGFTADNTATSPQQFTDIGVAIQTLGLAGKTSVRIGVRKTATTYTETTSPSSVPSRVELIGLGTGSALDNSLITWNTNGKVIGFNVLHAVGFLFSTTAANGNGDLFTVSVLNAENCIFNLAGTATAITKNGSDAYLTACVLNPTGSPGFVNFTMESGMWRVDANLTAVGHSTLGANNWTFTGTDFLLLGPSTLTLTAPKNLIIVAAPFTDGWNTSSAAMNGTLAVGTSTQRVSIFAGSGRAGQYNLTVTNPGTAVIVGHFPNGTLTVTNATALGSIYISGVFFQTVDITGPLVTFDIVLGIGNTTANQAVKLRGANLNGRITLRYNNTTTGIAIQGIGLTDSVVSASTKLIAAASTQQAYNEDGASARNIVDIAGGSQFPTASAFQASTLSRVS